MGSLLEYECKAEHTDEDAEILDVDHCEKLTQAFIDQEPLEGTNVVFCLVCNEYSLDDPGNLIDRFHWYPLENGQDGEDEFTPPKNYMAEAKAFGLL